MTTFDSFMFNDEFDILEMRLLELEKVPNLVHVLVEANVTHQDRPKPYHFAQNRDRFAPWLDRIIHVKAKNLPLVLDHPDPWAREHAQREWIGQGLDDAGARDDDILLQSDVDEIPTVVAARNVRPRGGFVAFAQRGHFWSVNWKYPHPWHGTVAGLVGHARATGFGPMRDVRNTTPVRIPNAGWHFSWLPSNGLSSTEQAVKKVGSYCHPEVTDRIIAGLESERFLRYGVHVDGVQMSRCEVDSSFPRYIREGRAPKAWFL